MDDDLFDPSNVSISRGETVVFDYVGASQHTATDGTGMDLYDSGPVDGGGASTWFTYVAAGRYPFVCTMHAGMDGTVQVPLRIEPRSGGVHRDYTVTVASDAASAPSTYDLQVKPPGSGRWRWVEKGFAAATQRFRPGDGRGTYRFRARMRVPGIGESGWSAVGRLRVG